MDSNSGLPSEILVLCTTTETKEKAVKLLEWIRHIPDIHGELAEEPAMPAICSLIASEQLGNTVVTERRALQWSRTTPERFRTVMSRVQKLLVASRRHHQPQIGHLYLRALVADFCVDQNAMSRVLTAEKAFTETNGSESLRFDSDLYVVLLTTRNFSQIRTLKPIEEIQRCHDFPTSSVNELQNFLDDHCLPTLFKAQSVDVSPENSRPPAVPTPPTSTQAASIIEGVSSVGSLIGLEDLARDYEVADDAMRGMRYVDKVVHESDDFKNLIDWSSILGRCAVFYWTCSVLKIPGAKHITLRKRFHLRKGDFDRLLSALDVHRGTLRKELESFYAEYPPMQALPQSTQWAANAPKRLYAPVPQAPDLAIRKSASPDRLLMIGNSTVKRGRPPKTKSPPLATFLDPISKQEGELLSLCAGRTLRRALLLLRSFNAKSHLASESDHISPEALPAMIAFVASRQLGDVQMGERKALQASGLLEDVFVVALARLRATIDVFEARHPFASQTTFDDLALEHGLGIDPVLCMLHVRQALRNSRCLSVGMDWDSTVLKCSVFFWTCAILKVPDVKQTLLRSRSLVSKREFDSMLQLLNSHCAEVRQQLETTSANVSVFAPPPYKPQPSITLDEVTLEAGNGKRKRAKRDTMAPSAETEPETIDNQCYAYLLPRRPGRPAGYRKVRERDDDSEGTAASTFSDADSIYIPTTPFPPADWEPPESLSNKGCASSYVCPSSETGDSKRHHTRYSTADYQDSLDGRIELWKPNGEEVEEQQAQYRQWEEKMVRHYGPQWEKDISHEQPGIPFE